MIFPNAPLISITIEVLTLFFFPNWTILSLKEGFIMSLCVLHTFTHKVNLVKFVVDVWSFQEKENYLWRLKPLK